MCARFRRSRTNFLSSKLNEIAIDGRAQQLVNEISCAGARVAVCVFSIWVCVVVGIFDSQQNIKIDTAHSRMCWTRFRISVAGGWDFTCGMVGGPLRLIEDKFVGCARKINVQMNVNSSLVTVAVLVLLFANDCKLRVCAWIFKKLLNYYPIL